MGSLYLRVPQSVLTESRSFNTSPALFVIPSITRRPQKDLRKISSNKATGLDKIRIRLLKLPLPAISLSRENIYNESISSDFFRDALKKNKVTLIHKKKSTHEGGNFRL